MVNIRGCEFTRNGRVEKGLEIIYAKSNDSLLPPPVSVWLNPETFVYEQVTDFNHKAWKTTLDKLAQTRSSMTPAAQAQASEDALPAVAQYVTKLIESQGKMTRDELVRHLIAGGHATSQRAACKLLGRLVEDEEVLHYWSDGPRVKWRFDTLRRLKEEVA